jgi:hypothetical protein
VGDIEGWAGARGTSVGVTVGGVGTGESDTILAQDMPPQAKMVTVDALLDGVGADVDVAEPPGGLAWTRLCVALVQARLGVQPRAKRYHPSSPWAQQTRVAKLGLSGYLARHPQLLAGGRWKIVQEMLRRIQVT